MEMVLVLPPESRDELDRVVGDAGERACFDASRFDKTSGRLREVLLGCDFLLVISRIYSKQDRYTIQDK